MRLALLSALLLTVRPASAAEPVHLRLGATLNDDVTPIVYAQRSGMFRRAGLDVELQAQPNGAAIASAVAAGSFDIGKSSLVSLFNAHLRGLPFVLIAPAAMSDVRQPYSALVVASDAPIRAARDLDGKTIAVQSLNDLNEVVTAAWVDQHGGDSKTLRYVEMPMSAAGSAIVAHRVDAAVLVHPPLDAALATGKVRILGDAYGAVAPRFVVSGWFTTSQWAASHREEARRFVRVVEEAAAYTNAHHAQTARMMSEVTEIPLGVIEKMTRAVDGTTLSVAEIQPLLDAAVRYKTVSRAFRVDELLWAESLTKTGG